MGYQHLYDLSCINGPYLFDFHFASYEKRNVLEAFYGDFLSVPIDIASTNNVNIGSSPYTIILLLMLLERFKQYFPGSFDNGHFILGGDASSPWRIFSSILDKYLPPAVFDFSPFISNLDVDDNTKLVFDKLSQLVQNDLLKSLPVAQALPSFQISDHTDFKQIWDSISFNILNESLPSQISSFIDDMFDGLIDPSTQEFALRLNRYIAE